MRLQGHSFYPKLERSVNIGNEREFITNGSFFDSPGTDHNHIAFASGKDQLAKVREATAHLHRIEVAQARDITLAQIWTIASTTSASVRLDTIISKPARII
jgi:hypothetical protein